MTKTNLLLIGLIICSCSNQFNEKEQQENPAIIVPKNSDDSGESSISIEPLDTSTFFHNITIKNVVYSIEWIDSNIYGPHFICKTTSTNEHADAFADGIYSERKEIFDFAMNKICELSVPHREIELYSEYYLAKDLFPEAPDYFELYNYRTQKAFIRYTNQFWTVEIPNTKVVGYVGYQKSRNYLNSDSSNLIGVLYFSINQTINFEIEIKSKKSSEFNLFNPLISFKLEASNVEDKIGHRSLSEIRNPNLTLWSKNGKDNIELLTGFDVVLKIKKNQYDKISDNTETIEKRIPIIDGLPYGKKTADGRYEMFLE